MLVTLQDLIIIIIIIIIIIFIKIIIIIIIKPSYAGHSPPRAQSSFLQDLPTWRARQGQREPFQKQIRKSMNKRVTSGDPVVHHGDAMHLFILSMERLRE